MFSLIHNFAIAAVVVVVLGHCGNHGIAQEKSAVQRDPVKELTKDREKAMIRKIYESTRTARTAGDFTELIESCREGMKKKISDKNQKYLNTLEAWGLYRRGVARCELAKIMRQAKNTEQASEVFDKAAEDLETSLALDPTSWKPILGLGLVKAERGDYLGAIDSFTQLCTAKPKETAGWFNRGEIYYTLERFEKAIADYNQVIELEPADLQAITGRAHCHFKTGDFAAALKDYQVVATMLPENDSAMINVGDAQQQLGNWKAAYDRYFAAMTIKASEPGAQKSAWLLATCPNQEFFRPTLAVQLAEKAIELGGESHRNLDTLAAAQAANGDFESAKKTQELAMAKLPQATEDQKTRLAKYSIEERFVQADPQQKKAAIAELENPLKPKNTIRE